MNKRAAGSGFLGHLARRHWIGRAVRKYVAANMLASDWKNYTIKHLAPGLNRYQATKPLSRLASTRIATQTGRVVIGLPQAMIRRPMKYMSLPEAASVATLANIPILGGIKVATPLAHGLASLRKPYRDFMAKKMLAPPIAKKMLAPPKDVYRGQIREA